MRITKFFFKTIWFLFFSVLIVGAKTETSLDEKLTESIRPHWPYEAFLAIPRIAEIHPSLAVEVSKQGQSVLTSSCIEIDHFELQKKFEPKAILERESLHKLLCKAMKRAIEKAPHHQIIEIFPKSTNIAFSFDFYNGLIKVIETPYPPLSPREKLENVFLDETDVLSFGDIDLPEEVELEINQTAL